MPPSESEPPASDPQDHARIANAPVGDQERKQAEFALAMRLYDMLGDMTNAVDRINGARLTLDQCAASLTAGDPLRRQLQAASARVDELRRKIVATKEGGMITGEERLRENLCDLYGNVVNYEGRPTQTQVDRAGAIQHELADVVADFDAWVAGELPQINASLRATGAQPVALPVALPGGKEGK